MYFVTAVLTVRAALTGEFHSHCATVAFISGMWIENLFVAAGWRLLRRPVCLTHTSLWAQTGPEDERPTLTGLAAAAHSGTKGKQQSECGVIFQREAFKLVWSEVSSPGKQALHMVQGSIPGKLCWMLQISELSLQLHLFLLFAVFDIFCISLIPV